MRILNKKEIGRLVKASSGYLRSMIIIALSTAMRKGEILNLKWNDIDFVEDYIYIKESKSNVMRKVPMNPVAREVLKSIKREGDFVFINVETGTRFRDFYRAWKSVREKAGVPDLRFHDLRHSAATQMVMKGVDLVNVKDILGHANILMTVKYAHPTPESRRQAVNVLASLFEPEKKEKGGHNTVIGVN